MWLSLFCCYPVRRFRREFGDFDSRFSDSVQNAHHSVLALIVGQSICEAFAYLMQFYAFRQSPTRCIQLLGKKGNGERSKCTYVGANVFLLVADSIPNWNKSLDIRANLFKRLNPLHVFEHESVRLWAFFLGSEWHVEKRKHCCGQHCPLADICQLINRNPTLITSICHYVLCLWGDS